MKQSKFHVLVLAVLAVFILTSDRALFAQDAKPTEKEKKSEVTAIVGATVHPVTRGKIRRGTVIWKDGLLVDIGSELTVPEGATVIDGEGLYVCPGFVSVVSSGLGTEGSGGDLKSSLDPWGLNLRIALANGITTTQIYGSRFFGFFGGEAPLSAGANSAVIKLTYGELDSMFVREPAVYYFSLPSRNHSIEHYNLRDRFRRAKEYIQQRDEAVKKKAKPPRMARDLGTYVKILENKNPTIVTTRNREEVRRILDLSEEYKFDVVLNEPNDAWMMAREIAARGVPVLVKSRGADFNFAMDGKVLEEGDMSPVRRPAAFARAGVPVAILPYKRGISLSGLAGRDLSTLALDAAFAVRGGMTDDQALASITIEPARVLKVADRVGSLEKGKDADVLILSGPPLDYRSFVLKAYIGGKLYYDHSKSRIYRKVPLSKDK